MWEETWGHVTLQCQRYEHERINQIQRLTEKKLKFWFMAYSATKSRRHSAFVLFFKLQIKLNYGLRAYDSFRCCQQFLGLSWLRMLGWLWLSHSKSRDFIDERSRLKNMHTDLSSRFVRNLFYTQCPCQRADTCTYFLKWTRMILNSFAHVGLKRITKICRIHTNGN